MEIREVRLKLPREMITSMDSMIDRLMLILSAKHNDMDNVEIVCQQNKDMLDVLFKGTNKSLFHLVEGVWTCNIGHIISEKVVIAGPDKVKAVAHLRCDSPEGSTNKSPAIYEEPAKGRAGKDAEQQVKSDKTSVSPRLSGLERHGFDMDHELRRVASKKVISPCKQDGEITLVPHVANGTCVDTSETVDKPPNSFSLEQRSLNSDLDHTALKSGSAGRHDVTNAGSRTGRKKTDNFKSRSSAHEKDVGEGDEDQLTGESKTLKASTKLDLTTACLICGRRVSKNSLFRHVDRIHYTAKGEYQTLKESSETERLEILKRIEEKVSLKRQEVIAMRHSTTKTLLTCTVCKKPFPDLRQLRSHVNAAHGNAESPSPGRSVYYAQCPYCSIRRPGGNIVKHMRASHGEKDDFEGQVQEILEDIAAYKRQRRTLYRRNAVHMCISACRFCGASFGINSSRSEHEKFCSANPERIRRLECGVCGRKSRTREELANHVATHPDKNFVCALCGRAYKTRGGITTHTRSAHGVATRVAITHHTCEHCGKTFIHRNQWQRHLNAHRSERTCSCELCGKLFKDVSQVRKHQRSVHENRYAYHCERCGHGCDRRGFLETHVCGRVRRSQARVTSQTQDDITEHSEMTSKDTSVQEDVEHPKSLLVRLIGHDDTLTVCDGTATHANILILREPLEDPQAVEPGCFT